MEERIKGMVTFLTNNIDVLVRSDKDDIARGELLKCLGIASACYQLVPDQRFLDIIDRVNGLLYPVTPEPQRLERCARRQSQGFWKSLFQMPRRAALA